MKLNWDQLEFIAELMSDYVYTHGEVDYHHHNDKSNRVILPYSEIEHLWMLIQEQKANLTLFSPNP